MRKFLLIGMSLLTLTLTSSTAEAQKMGEPIRFVKTTSFPVKDTLGITNTGKDTAYVAFKKYADVYTFFVEAKKVSGTPNVRVVFEGSGNDGRGYVVIDSLTVGNVTGDSFYSKTITGVNNAYTKFRARAYGVTGSMVVGLRLWMIGKREDD